MLCVIPSAAYGRLGAVLSALIVCACVIGLTMHKDFYAGKRRKDFFCFYTNLSNLLVLVYFALIAPRLYAHKSLYPLIPHAEFSVMMCIMLTFCVFHALIFPAVSLAAKHAPRTREFCIAVINNMIVHYLVPWLVFAYWLLCSPSKRSLRASDAFLWTLIPAVYLAYVFLRAQVCGIIEETGSLYPYPFLDAGFLGVQRVMRICCLLYCACAAAGMLFVACIRGVIALLGTGYPLFLI